MITSLITRITKTGPGASFLFVLLTSLLLVACSETQEQYVFSGLTMGTTYQVKVVPGKVPVPDNFGKTIQSTLEELDSTFSTYQTDSELMSLNRTPVGETMSLSQPMLRVLGISDQVFQLTGGAFDPTVGPLVNLWGFGPDPSQDKVPELSKIRAQLNRIGFGKLAVDHGAASARRTADIQLDLSAVAKGFAVDVVAELLASQGLVNYLVEVGGELRTNGLKANGQPWRIAIESPTLERREVQQALALGNAAIATSGDYRNYFERGGKRYSHTIDPRTGFPITHQLASVTVIAEDTASADALATGLMVLGHTEALALAEKNDLAIYLLVKEETEFKAYYSSAFAPYLSGE